LLFENAHVYSNVETYLTVRNYKENFTVATGLADASFLRR